MTQTIDERVAQQAAIDAEQERRDMEENADE